MWACEKKKKKDLGLSCRLAYDIHKYLTHTSAHVEAGRKNTQYVHRQRRAGQSLRCFRSLCSLARCRPIYSYRLLCFLFILRSSGIATLVGRGQSLSNMFHPAFSRIWCFLIMTNGIQIRCV
jgi:hypothetical protein